MAINPLNLARVSTMMRGNQLNATVTSTQRELAAVQQQLTTGRRLASPSDDAGDAAIAQQVRKLLEKRDAYDANMSAAGQQLAEVDSTLSDVTDLLREAQQIASANVGSDVTEDARTAAAEIIDSIYNQMLSMANKSSNGVYLFAGDRNTNAPFVESGGGVQWVGSSQLLTNVVDEGTQLGFQTDGAEIFGALSSRVEGTETLTPAANAATRLDDLAGSADKGIRRGIIAVSDGTTTVNVDLRNADTLGDVVSRINAAGVGGISAAINAAGDGIDLTAGAGDEMTVTDVGGGGMADDLGIRRDTSAGTGVGLNGQGLAPSITPLTTLASLKGGAGIDLTGLTITNGSVTKQIDLSGASTVEDLLNTINDAGANVTARINKTGDGIDILNSVQGTPLTIAENGGSTAADLGVRSYAPETKLADLNNGDGVGNVDGADLALTDSNGIAFEVDFNGLNTVMDLINAINAASTTAGAGLQADFDTATNALVLTDTAGGPDPLKAENANNSDAVKALGLDGAVSGNRLTGTDVAPVRSTGVFADLIRLRNALRSSDQSEITRAAEGLDESTTTVIRVRGQVGARVQAYEARQERLADQNTATMALLSELEDTDFTSAIVKFQTLQTSLQATMQASSRTMNLSLMDYL